ncbi:alpha-L-fucosidase [Halomontanus rarus]|uniref:alpha-L-fucosidase n=1 Tax=Halomontanus rarus TaxID=3034020 RepID=UPI0023E7FB93|nr:alpha-L-fucosidase [Halovivax sp. TS33]
MGVSYEPTWESIDEHPVPDWFHDAKLGIFIHWGPYSVPGWAPVGNYAEWYPFGMYNEDSEIREYHEEHWGEDVEYVDFAEMWEAENWDPDEWAEFFESVGAQYVVLTGEHHDGFPLWDTHYSKYNAADMGPERDIVGELCEAVRDRGLRFAPSYHANQNYYQPGFDGLFGHPDYHATTIEDAEPGPEYVDFMNVKHRELIRKYEPDLLWFDTPRIDGDRLHAQELIVDYYERAAEEWDKEVAVNDRAARESWGHHGDFVTPEYDTLDEILEYKWEMCRGVGYSFGYNCAEDEDDHLSGEELVELFVDCVSKNGNLLINVGPKADGTIPDLQREPIETLGEWLSDHGEAIYGTRPWTVWGWDPNQEEDDEEDGKPKNPDIGGYRYAWKAGTLYVFLVDDPDGEVALPLGEHVSLPSSLSTSVVGDGTTVDCAVEGSEVRIDVPEAAVDEHVTVVEIDEIENPMEWVTSED